MVLLKALKACTISRGKRPAFSYTFAENEQKSVDPEHLQALISTGKFQIMEDCCNISEVQAAISEKAEATHEHAYTDIVGLTGEIENKVAELIDSAPDSLNTLNELAAALGDDANFATTVTNNLAGKSDINHNHDLIYSDILHQDKRCNNFYYLELNFYNYKTLYHNDCKSYLPPKK